MSSDPKTQKLFDEGRHEILKGNYKNGINFLTKVINLEPNHKLGLITRGSAYIKMEKLEEAVSDFDRAVDLDPHYSRAYHLRGVAKEGLGENDAALDDISKAIDVDPEYGAAYFSRATLLTKMRREEEAVEDIEMVQHLTNKSIESFANENNIWRSQQLKLESMFESELGR